MLVFEPQVAVGPPEPKACSSTGLGMTLGFFHIMFLQTLKGDTKQVEESVWVCLCMCVSTQKCLLNCFLYKELIKRNMRIYLLEY